MSLRPIFYDTETTGIKSEKDRIIELAAYDPQRDKTFSKLMNPGMPIPAGATAVHHITDEMVAEEPTFKEIAAEFVEFCEGDSVLIAHNNDGFDVHFLRKEFSRSEMEMPEWKFFDTLKWSRRYRSDLPKHTLQFLREIYNIEANNAHRALDDVMVLYKVYMGLVDDLSLETILSLMAETKAVTRMPFGKHQGKSLDKVPSEYVKWLKENGALDKPENGELLLGFQKLGILVAG